MSILDMSMTANKLARAKTQVYNVCGTGQTISLVKSATKDEMGTSTSETILELKSHPVRFSPFDRDVNEKIAWSENVDILCYISKLEIDNIPITIQKLKKQYNIMRFNGKTYTIRYIENYSSFGTDFLYVVIGGKI